jgi:hypothetical protein
MVPDSLTLCGETMSLGSWLKTPMFSSLYIGFGGLLHAGSFHKIWSSSPASFSEGRETYLWKNGQDGGIDVGSSRSATNVNEFLTIF